MKRYNKITGVLAVAALSLFSACSEDAMDRINKDNDHTTSVAARFILADVITSTAFSNSSGDLNTYASAYVEYEVGVDNQLFTPKCAKANLLLRPPIIMYGTVSTLR